MVEIDGEGKVKNYQANPPERVKGSYRLAESPQKKRCYSHKTKVFTEVPKG